ncbi:MAG: hypothetical protein Q7R91_02690 [bacterium]|nr:hypothetical protein [bacterium]
MKTASIKTEAVRLTALAYLVGFIAWNYFLSHFGFFEYNLLQTRFVSAGVLFISPVVLCLVLYKFFQIEVDFKIYEVAALLLVYFFVFVILEFPLMPQYFGGARPFATSLIGTKEQIKYLRNFGIQSEKNVEGEESIQTKPVCQIYQNNEFIIVGVAMPEGDITKDAPLTLRVRGGALILKQNQVSGFNSIDTQLAKGADILCAPFLHFKF